MSLHTGETLLSLVPPRNSLVSVLEPWKGLLSGHGATLGTEVPGHCQEQLTQTMIVRLLKMQFFPLLKWGGGRLGTPKDT